MMEKVDTMLSKAISVMVPFTFLFLVGHLLNAIF